MISPEIQKILKEKNISVFMVKLEERNLLGEIVSTKFALRGSHGDHRLMIEDNNLVEFAVLKTFKFQSEFLFGSEEHCLKYVNQALMQYLKKTTYASSEEKTIYSSKAHTESIENE